MKVNLNEIDFNDPSELGFYDIELVPDLFIPVLLFYQDSKIDKQFQVVIVQYYDDNTIFGVTFVDSDGNNNWIDSENFKDKFKLIWMKNPSYCHECSAKMTGEPLECPECSQEKNWYC